MSLVRNLNEYKWELIDKKVILTNKKLKSSFILDKVRLMSFMKFAPNCLDRMRIEEGKNLRKLLKTTKEKDILKREKSYKIIKTLREQIKNIKSVKQLNLLKGKANIKK